MSVKGFWGVASSDIYQGSICEGVLRGSITRDMYGWQKKQRAPTSWLNGIWVKSIVMVLCWSGGYQWIDSAGWYSLNQHNIDFTQLVFSQALGVRYFLCWLCLNRCPWVTHRQRQVVMRESSECCLGWTWTWEFETTYFHCLVSRVHACVYSYVCVFMCLKLKLQ